MHKLWIVTKNEFSRYFISPLAYVYLICFLLLNGSFAIYFGHFFERGRADLLPMFSFQPWLYLLFIPGISMRLWAEEFRSKTILQIITMPVSVTALVWGKFFASWLFCALALLLTFPFWITVNLLGTPDNTVIAVSYVGSFLLAGCMLAISQTMSALTKNQVIALVLSVIANLVFFLSGIEYVLGVFRGFLPLPVIDMIASFSFLTHFETIARGLFEARDAVFFATLIALFNITTILAVSYKTAGTTAWLKSSSRSSYIIAFVFLLFAFTGINLLANNTLRRFQYDFTEEKLYTLTDSTLRILQKLPEPVAARLYYSPILGQRNPDMRLMFDKVRILLERYEALSGGQFTYRIYDPVPLSDIEDRALNAGLQPLPVIENNTNAYFGLVLTDEADRRQVIPFFPLEREDLLEQDLTEALYLLHYRKPSLGLLTSLPMFEQIIDNVATAKWEMLNLLQKFYDVTGIPADNPGDLSRFDVLIIAHPDSMPPETEQAIKDYSYKGGKILLFADIAAEAPRIFSPTRQLLKASELGTLPQTWGFRFHDNAVVADMDNSSVVDATSDYRNNPSFSQDLIQFYLDEKNFNSKFKETALLKRMMLTSAGVFTPLQNSNTYFIPLLQASENSALYPSRVVYDNIHPADILRNFSKDANPKYIAARIISKDHSKPFELIVVGDSDLLYDNFWTIHKNIMENNYAVPVLDNANFVLNALDTLRGNDDLIGLRGKSGKKRPFAELESQRKLANREFRIQEKDIFDRMEQTKRGLQEIWGKRSFEGRGSFTSDELAAIAGIRKSLEQQRLRLFQIRSDMNTYVRHLDRKIKFANIYALPLLILLGLLVFVSRSRRCPCNSLSFRLNSRLLWLGGISLLLLSAGALAVRYSAPQNIASYEGKPVFPDLPQQINQVENITLSGQDRQLHFKLSDGIWLLEEAPDFIVYQDRMRSFMSALLEAAFYEKKSARLENHAKFGLMPVNDPGSPAVRVELANDAGKNLAAFEIGNYDIDLGRGAKGAYIKFDDRFQVWLVGMDLIDLSLDPADWTFSTAWNLRFGRLAAINQNRDSDTLAAFAAKLLNTKLLSRTPAPSGAHLLRSLTLEAEGNNSITLKLWQNNGKYYLSYEFLNNPGEKNLQNFAEKSKSSFYEISASDMEKLQNVIP